MDFSSYKLVHPFQIVGRFDFSKFIDIIMHLDIHYTPSGSTKVVVLESKPSAEKEVIMCFLRHFGRCCPCVRFVFRARVNTLPRLPGVRTCAFRLLLVKHGSSSLARSRPSARSPNAARRRSSIRVPSSLLTVQNRAQVHRKSTGDLVPFSPRRVLPRFVNPRIRSKPLRFSI
jgi:hypothetical protein